MTGTAERSPTNGDAFGQLLRGSVLPTGVAGALSVLVGLLSGPRAGWSAAFGALLVIAFFSLTLLVMRRTADLPATTVMMVVMATYTVKVLGLGLVMFLVRDVTWVSGYAVGVTITVCTLVWLFFEMRSYRRLRIFAYDPPGHPSQVARPTHGSPG